MYGYATAEGLRAHFPSCFPAERRVETRALDGAMERIASGVQSFLAKANRRDAATDWVLD
jgi:hypothetical protein